MSVVEGAGELIILESEKIRSPVFPPGYCGINIKQVEIKDWLQYNLRMNIFLQTANKKYLGFLLVICLCILNCSGISSKHIKNSEKQNDKKDNRPTLLIMPLTDICENRHSWIGKGIMKMLHDTYKEKYRIINYDKQKMESLIIKHRYTCGYLKVEDRGTKKNIQRFSKLFKADVVIAGRAYSSGKDKDVAYSYIEIRCVWFHKKMPHSLYYTGTHMKLTKAYFKKLPQFFLTMGW